MTKPTDEQYIEQAKQYAIAQGNDPKKIKTVEDAERRMDYMAEQCAMYGSD